MRQRGRKGRSKTGLTEFEMYYRNMKDPGSSGTALFSEPWLLEKGRAFRHDKG
jgi:hypothetical protein